MCPQKENKVMGRSQKVTFLRQQPSSLRNEEVSGPKGPAVSIATG